MPGNGFLTDARQGVLETLRRRRDRDSNGYRAKGVWDMDAATHEIAIRQRAYAIWEAEGKPAGREWDHWMQASHEVLSRAPIKAPSEAGAPVGRPRKTTKGRIRAAIKSAISS